MLFHKDFSYNDRPFINFLRENKMNDLAHEQDNEDQLMKSAMEKIVPSYDAYMRKMTFGREHILRTTTVNLAQVKPGDCVLEIGCGTGTLTMEAKRQAGPLGKVFGIDIIPGMIELSQRKAAQANQDIIYQLGSIDDIPFSESQFDVVLCSFMIFHMSETTRRKGIAEIQRVLKPQGRLLVLDLALPSQPIQKAIAQRLFGGMLEHDLREIIPLMEASSFAEVEFGAAKFRVLGLAVLAFVRGSARKN
jgi:ubiquinone/menaquinone biosynthesis C-methylase UbiE